MKFNEFTYPSSDGIHSIHSYEYLPDGEIKAVIQVCHGISEHFGRYKELWEYMTSRGVAVCGNDHLGHGKTAEKSEYGYFADENGWQRVCDDVVRLFEIEKKKYNNAKYCLFGHSMGSFIARTVFMQGSIDADCYIFSGTGHQSGLTVKSGKLIGKAVRKTKKSKYDSDKFIKQLAFGSYNKKFEKRTECDWISSDKVEVDRYMSDPMCNAPVSVGLFIDMLDGLDIIRKQKNYASCPKKSPVLFVSGTSDPVGQYGKGVEKVYSSMLKAGVNAKKYMYEGRHELFHEPVRENVLGDIYEWLSV